MSPFRKDLIRRVFKKLDDNESNRVEVDKIMTFFNPKQHPDVKQSKKNEQEVLQEFKETFEAWAAMNVNGHYNRRENCDITLSEFLDYYSNVSASIESDEAF